MSVDQSEPRHEPVHEAPPMSWEADPNGRPMSMKMGVGLMQACCATRVQLGFSHWAPYDVMRVLDDLRDVAPSSTFIAAIICARSHDATPETIGTEGEHWDAAALTLDELAQLRAAAAKPPVEQPRATVSHLTSRREPRVRAIDKYAADRQREHENAIKRAQQNGGHIILDINDV